MLLCVNDYLVFASLLDGVRLLAITTVVELTVLSWWFLICKPILVGFILLLQNTQDWVTYKEERFISYTCRVWKSRVDRLVLGKSSHGGRQKGKRGTRGSNPAFP